MKDYIDQNALFLQGWSIYLIAVHAECSSCNSWSFSIKLFSDTFSSFGAQKNPFSFAAVRNKDYSPTDESVFSRKVEVAVQLQVLYPLLHPLLLDVCANEKHLLKVYSTKNKILAIFWGY